MIPQTSPNPHTQIQTQAAATSSSPPTSSSTQFRGSGQQQEYSCVFCKQRKVRCDRGNPCTGCVRAGVSCVPGSRQPYKRRKRVHSQSGSLNETELSARSRDIYSAPSRSLDNRPAQGQSRPQRQAPTFGQNLWTGLNDEFQDLRANKSSSEEDAPASSEFNQFLDPTTLLFSTIRDVVNLRDFHPAPMQAFMLWQTFLQNVNPLSKVIHAPLVQPIVIEASKDFDTVPKPSIALLFAIYAAAVMSLKDEDCQSQLNAPKTLLLTRYFSACQQALAAASFMNSRNLVTLQAFVIFLLPARQIYDVQTFWLLAGIAVRLGMRLTGENDSESAGDSVYNSQLRRRLWRQIVWIDGRSHQHIGLKPPLYEVRVFPLPANLNDADINPNMTEIPLIHKGPTEMTFCLCRYEVGEFMTQHARRLHDPSIPIRDKDALIDQFEAHMNESYLKYLDSAIPLHLMAEGGVRSAICKMRLMAHHPSQYPDRGKCMPRTERDMLFQMAVQMVEYDVLGKSTRSLDSFSWHLDVAFQIDAFVFMLIASRTQVADASLTRKAWHLVSEMYKHRPALLEETNNELYAAVRELTLRAWEAREADIARSNLDSMPMPDVIAKLRERKARKMHARTASATSISIPPEASALHQLAGVATQVDARNVDSSMGFMSGIPAAFTETSFQADVDQQFDGMFDNFSADIDISGWAPVDWDYWNNLLERNNVLQ